MGLTGVGDLILTATGDLSRNRQVGLALGRGRSISPTRRRTRTCRRGRALRSCCAGTSARCWGADADHRGGLRCAVRRRYAAPGARTPARARSEARERGAMTLAAVCVFCGSQAGERRGIHRGRARAGAGAGAALDDRGLRRRPRRHDGRAGRRNAGTTRSHRRHHSAPPDAPGSRASRPDRAACRRIDARAQARDGRTQRRLRRAAGRLRHARRDVRDGDLAAAAAAGQAGRAS